MSSRHGEPLGPSPGATVSICLLFFFFCIFLLSNSPYIYVFCLCIRNLFQWFYLLTRYRNHLTCGEMGLGTRWMGIGLREYRYFIYNIYRPSLSFAFISSRYTIYKNSQCTHIKILSHSSTST